MEFVGELAGSAGGQQDACAILRATEVDGIVRGAPGEVGRLRDPRRVGDRHRHRRRSAEGDAAESKIRRRYRKICSRGCERKKPYHPCGEADNDARDQALREMGNAQ